MISNNCNYYYFNYYVVCMIFIILGKMFPTQALFYTAPFSDEALYMEQYTKASFWYDDPFYFNWYIWYVIILICRFQPQFKGVDVSPLKDAAMDEYFTQPVKVCILWLLTYYLLVNYGQSDHRKVVEWQMHNSWKSLIGCCERSKTSFIFHATFPTLFNNVGNVAWMHWMTKASVLCNLSLYWPHPHAGLKHFLVYSNYHFILHGN